MDIYLDLENITKRYAHWFEINYGPFKMLSEGITFDLKLLFVQFGDLATLLKVFREENEKHVKTLLTSMFQKC